MSFNTKDITDNSLEAVKKSKDYFRGKDGGGVEVIVVENGSNDGSASMIRSKHPWVDLIDLKENTGFAKGNNIGMKASAGKYILLLNSDAFLEKDTLLNALSYMNVHSDCDVLGCKLTYEDGQFQPSAGYLPTPVNVFYWMLMLDKVPILRNIIHPFHPNNESFFRSDRSVGWITGAFMLLKRKVFEETGGFDEHYFMYTEEVEWCKRIKDAGFNVVFTPSFEIIHKKFASSNYDIKKPIISETKGMLYFFKKHYPGYIWFVRLSLFLGYGIRVIAFLFLNSREKAKAYSSMLKDGIWKKLE